MFLLAKKSLGQHFLNSKHVLSQIIEAAHISKGESVLEIGPGTGILTSALLQAEANVTAVEKDERAIGQLAEKFSKEITDGQLRLIQGDILDDQLLGSASFVSSLVREKMQEVDGLNNGKYAIVANIPYYITGAILEKFLENENKPDRMVLLVQKEVADRIVAKDGKESILSVSVKVFGQPKIIAKVPPGAFTPPPTVDSAILAIENINNNLFVGKNVEIPNFFKIIKAGFAHKRKFTARNLETVIEKGRIEEIWHELSLDPKVRAEDMPIEKWVLIANALK